MRTWIVFLIIYLCLNESPFLINREEVKKIQSKATWHVQDPDSNIFNKWTTKQISVLLGAIPSKPNAQIDMQSNIMMSAMPVKAAPTNFDGRTSYGSCLAPIKNQGSCGSCWAHAIVDSFSVTRCLKKLSSGFKQLSIQYLVSCDTKDWKCEGGCYQYGYQFMTSTGVVTDTCFPYTSGSGTAPACPTKCVNSESISTKYKCKSGTTVNIASKLESAKTWISGTGPMWLSFAVYNDFFNYKSGVYYHVSGDLAGYHAVQVVGYGVDTTTKLNYWLCQNSWSASWGEKGFFKIKMGDSSSSKELVSCIPAN